MSGHDNHHDRREEDSDRRTMPARTVAHACRPRAVLAALLAFGLIVAVARTTGAAPAIASTPIGDPHGIALFATMHRAYTRAAGVELTIVSRGRTHATFGRFLLQLRAGTVTAEGFVSSRTDPMTVVARRHGPTYAWQASGRCWLRLAPADPRTLTEVGLPFPYGRGGAKAMPPKRTANTLTLSTENRDDFWFLATQTVYKPTAKRFVVYTIDARSGRIRAINVQALQNGNPDIRPGRHPKLHWWTATLRVTTLSSPPPLPRPTHAC